MFHELRPIEDLQRLHVRLDAVTDHLDVLRLYLDEDAGPTEAAGDLADRAASGEGVEDGGGDCVGVAGTGRSPAEGLGFLRDSIESD